MKTTVSIPNHLVEETESLAAELGLSRSALVARALRLFITRQRRASITERLNAVYAQQPAAAKRLLIRAGWQATTDEW